MIELIDNFYWPKAGGLSCRSYTLERADVPQRISKYCKNKNIVLHAGANVGFYAAQYAEIFNAQYLFEPDFLNFYCLNLNVLKNNTYKFQAFLGDKHGLFNLEMNESDSGGHNIGPNPSPGQIPMIKIDDLELNDLSLVHLDCEGFERQVIFGGLETIKIYKPLVVVEASWNKDFSILENINYNKIDDISGDWVFKYNE